MQLHSAFGISTNKSKIVEHSIILNKSLNKQHLEMQLQTTNQKIEAILNSFTVNHPLFPTNQTISSINKLQVPLQTKLGSIVPLTPYTFHEEPSTKVYFKVRTKGSKIPLCICFNQIKGCINILASSKYRHPWYDDAKQTILKVDKPQCAQIFAGEYNSIFETNYIYICFDCKTRINASIMCGFEQLELQIPKKKLLLRAKTALGTRVQEKQIKSMEQMIKGYKTSRSNYEQLIKKAHYIRVKKTKKMLELSKNRDILEENKDVVDNYKSIQTQRESRNVRTIYKIHAAKNVRESLNATSMSNKVLYMHRWDIRREYVITLPGF